MAIKRRGNRIDITGNDASRIARAILPSMRDKKAEVDYEKEVRVIYPVRSDIDCAFYLNKKAKEMMWHVDVIDYEKSKSVCIGKGLFKINAWKSAYEYLFSQGLITPQTTEANEKAD